MLTEVGVDADNADPRATVGHSTLIRTERSAGEIPAYKPRDAAGARVTVGALMAEGHVSAVYAGTQHSMRRAVAVRSVNPKRRDPTAAGRILSEAWMLGTLEHPNIIPVYGVGKDDQGQPLVLMRAVNTVPWSKVLATPDHRLGCPRGYDPVEFNVRRVLGVCRALEHAHERGIVHRDVKPDHVLIDRDGSVYLHGWSLGVAIVDDGTGRWPLAAEQTQIAGTPAYMAPELATRNVRALSARTDVYLVAATLHHVLTGRARHLGENVFDAFYSAVRSEPIEYSGVLPAGLGAILNQAMAPDPRLRFSSMTELRLALEGFLRHLPSNRLTAEADVSAAELEHAIAAGLDDVTIQELFATAYATYHAALREWPRNEAASRSAARVTGMMVRYEMDHGREARARDLLARMRNPPPELVQRAARTAAASMRGGDSEGRRKARTLFVGAAALVWTVYPIVFIASQAAELVAPTLRQLQIGAAGAWLVLIGVVAAMGPTLVQDLRNRAVTLPIAAVLISSLAIQLYAVRLDVEAMNVINLHHLLFFVITSLLTAAVDLRMWPSAAAYLVAFVAGTAVPDLALWLMAASNAVGLGWSTWFVSRHHDVIEARVL